MFFEFTNLSILNIFLIKRIMVHFVPEYISWNHLIRTQIVWILLLIACFTVPKDNVEKWIMQLYGNKLFLTSVEDWHSLCDPSCSKTTPKKYMLLHTLPGFHAPIFSIATLWKAHTWNTYIWKIDQMFVQCVKLTLIAQNTCAYFVNIQMHYDNMSSTGIFK